MVYKRAWAEISLSSLVHNLTVLCKFLPKNTDMMGIVKADAYGHGAVPVARAFVDAGVRHLGVAICEEGLELRMSGIDVPVLVMGFTPDQLLYEVVRHNLTQTVFSLAGASALAAQAVEAGKRVAVHIKIDTGMSRLGFLPNEKSVAQICEIASNPRLDITGIYTHFATSDALDNSFMFEQHERFMWMLSQLALRGVHIPIKHVSNSGAFSHIISRIGRDVPLGVTGGSCVREVSDISMKEIFHSQHTSGGYDRYLMDAVRVGIMLYGYPPSAEMIDVCAPLGLRPAMRLFSRVSMVKELDAGVGISYGHIYKTQQKSTIAVLPIGYADGYPRRLSHGGKVLVNGQFAPIAGAICMDQCMVDITGIQDVNPGDPVVMMGEPGICADNLAEIVGTISYEILCGVGKRVPRVYV